MFYLIDCHKCDIMVILLNLGVINESSRTVRWSWGVPYRS